MKRLTIILGLFVLTWSLGFTQSSTEEPSLAELARQEQERRSRIKQEVPLITNESLSTMTRARVSQATRSAEPEKEAPKAEEEPSIQPLKTSSEGEEIDWNQLFSEATLAYRTAVNNHLVLQLRFNNLRNAFFNEDDGTTQSLIQTQMQETAEKLEANQKVLHESRQKIGELQKAAAGAGLNPREIRELVGELPEPESILSPSTPTP